MKPPMPLIDVSAGTAQCAEMAIEHVYLNGKDVSRDVARATLTAEPGIEATGMIWLCERDDTGQFMIDYNAEGWPIGPRLHLRHGVLRWEQYQ